MSLARKIFSNTAWQILGKVVTAVLGIISIKFITNYLSRSTYGEYTAIYDYTAVFAIIADFGLFTIAVREMAHDARKEVVEKIVGNVLSIRTLFAIGALGLGVLLAFLIPVYRGSHIPLGVFIVSIATTITLIGGTMSSVLQFHLRMHWASIALTLGKIITVGYIIATVLFLFPKNSNAGFPHLQIAWIIGSLFTLSITYYASRKLIPIHFSWDTAFWKEVLRKALPYGLALVLGTIYFRMGTIMLSLFNMKEQAGYYGVPLRFLEILQIIPHYFMNSVLPVLTLSLKENSERSSKIVRYSLNILALLAFPILIGGWLLAWPIIATVSSPDFLSHRDTTGALIFGSDIGLKILLVAMAFTYLHVGLNYVLVAMGRQLEILWVNLFAVMVNITLNFLLAPRFGFIGAAIAVTVTEAAMLIILFYRVRKRMRGVWDLPFLGKTLLSSIAMGVVLFASADYFINTLLSKSLVLLIPLGAVTFGFMMFATRAITKDMIALFRKTEPSIEEIQS